MSVFRTPYPTYDVLDKWDGVSWNDATRRVVRERLACVPARRFFTAAEWNLLEAVCNRLVPQPDRPGAAVPIVPWIDAKLHDDRGDGYRHEAMPPMRSVWRLGLQGIESEAWRRHDRSFVELHAAEQDALLTAIQRGEVVEAPWDTLPPQRFFTHYLLKTVVGVYYAHPAAWSECGFGGPASPRGYVRLEADRHDAWEADDRRER